MSIPMGNLHIDEVNTYSSTMDKYEKRRLKLKWIIDNRYDGVNAKFARHVEKDESYVNRMLYPEGKKGKKRIGDDLTDFIEDKLKLGRGWFDSEDDPAVRIYKTSNEVHQKIIENILVITKQEDLNYLFKTLEMTLELLTGKKISLCAENAIDNLEENQLEKERRKATEDRRELTRDTPDQNEELSKEELLEKKPLNEDPPKERRKSQRRKGSANWNGKGGI